MSNIDEFIAANESIAVQVNDPVVDKLVDLFTELQHDLDRHDDRDSVEAMKRNFVKDIFKKVDKVLTDRFGVKYKHVPSKIGYGIIASTPYFNSAVDPYKEKTYEWLKSLITACKSSDSCVGGIKDLESIESYEKDEMSILFNLDKSVDSIRKHMKVGKITIDYNTATIKNFPEDVTVVIIADFITYLKVINVTPRELVSFLIHEMGHQFEMLGNDYRRLGDTTVLVNTFVDTLRKNGDVREAIRMTLEETKGDETYDEGSLVSMYNALTSRVIRIMNEDNKYFYTDNEQLADQFSARFGLGKEVISGLHKIHSYYGNRNRPLVNVMYAGIAVFIVYFLLILLVTFLPLVAFGVSALLGISTIIISILQEQVRDNDHDVMTYDIYMQRAKRVKLDMIRQLRESKLDRKTRMNIISDIEYSESIIELYVKNRKVLALTSNILPWNIDTFTYTRLQKEQEELSENNLHKHYEKLRQFTEKD